MLPRSTSFFTKNPFFTSCPTGIAQKSRVWKPLRYQICSREGVRKGVSNAISQMVYGGVLTVNFPLRWGRRSLVKLVADEQFPFFPHSRKIYFAAIPLVDNDNVQQALIQQSISSKRMQTECLYQGVQRSDSSSNADRLTLRKVRTPNNAASDWCTA